MKQHINSVYDIFKITHEYFYVCTIIIEFPKGVRHVGIKKEDDLACSLCEKPFACNEIGVRVASNAMIVG